MKKREAKRIICESFAVHMDNGSTNEWLYYDDAGNRRSEEDARRMVAAFNELIAELWRRGGHNKPRRVLAVD